MTIPAFPAATLLTARRGLTLAADCDLCEARARVRVTYPDGRREYLCFDHDNTKEEN